MLRQSVACEVEGGEVAEADERGGRDLSGDGADGDVEGLESGREPGA